MTLKGHKQWWGTKKQKAAVRLVGLNHGRHFPAQIPNETVAQIKDIWRLDQRERHAAGFKFGTMKLHWRIADAFGLKRGTVWAIVYGKRRQKVRPAYLFQKPYTVPKARLEEIRRRRKP